MKVWALRTAALMALAAITAVATADSIDEVEKKIIKAAESVKSAQAKMKMTMNMDQGGQTVTGEGSGTVEYMQKDGKDLFRMEFKNQMVMKMGEQEMKIDQEMLSVGDGEFAWNLSTQMGQKSVTKQNIDDVDMNPSAEATFKQLRENYQLEVLPDEKVNDQDCWVVKGTPKAESQMASAMGNIKYWFSKESGMAVRMVTEDKAGKPAMTVDFTDIKLNANIDPSRFKFEAPEGVQVMDMTKSGGEGDAP